MDQELITYLDERFRESARQTQEQFAVFREEVARQFAAAREETNQQFAAAREETNRRFERIEERMEEGFRHTGVEIEGLHGQIRQVAEGVALANERLGLFQEDTADKLKDVRAEMRVLVGGAFEEIRALKTKGSGKDQEGPAPTT